MHILLQGTGDNHNDTNYVELVHDIGTDGGDAGVEMLWNVTSTTKSKNFASQSMCEQGDDDNYGFISKRVF